MMPYSFIKTKNDSFKGEALLITPLRESINALNCDITEKQVIEIANNLYADYDDLFSNKRDAWRNMRIENNDLFQNTVKWRKDLRLFIKKFGGKRIDE